MSIGLTYDPDLSGVEIALSDLPDGTVQVQRVVNPAATDALWARGVVRGGSALPIAGGVGSLDDYEFFADVANHYRVLPVDPPAGLLLTNQAGDTASTADTAVLDVANELRLGIDLQLDSYLPASSAYMLTKYDFTSDQRSYGLRIASDGDVELLISSNGTGFAVAAGAPFPAADGERVAVRGTVSVDDVTGDYTATLESAATRAGPWTQIAVGSGTLSGTALFAGTAPLVVGAAGDGLNPCGPGTVFSAWVEDTQVLVADADFADQPDGTVGFTDDAGLVWTVNGNGRIVGALLESGSITPSLAGQVWLKSIRYPALNRPVRLLDYGHAIQRPSRSHVRPIAGQSPGIGMHDQRLGREFVVHLMTQGPDHLIEAGEWDIILTAATVWFIHTPIGSNVPGGYVAIGDTAQLGFHRGTDSAVTFRLPCTIEKAPATEVTGTLLTAETVFRLYGDANALYAAHATGRSLLATIADPSDLVVI